MDSPGTAASAASPTASPAAAVPAAGEACGHCRQAILHSAVRGEGGLVFCCQGCLEVNALLGGREGGTYYALLEQVGRKAPKAAVGEEYSAFLATLDNPDVLAGIGRREPGRHAVHLESRELVCAACGWLVENLLRSTAGVLAFDVDFLRGEIFLAYDPARCSLKDILAATARFGYRFRPKPVDAPARPRPNHALLARLAVSGACFMNSMAFAAANYVGAFQDITPGWMRAFGILGYAVTLPAVAYAAFPFYAGAWRAMKAGRFSIDVTVTLGILLSFAVTTASVLGVIGGKEGNYADSLAGLVFFLLLGRWGVQRFEAGLALNGRWFDALRKGKIRVRRGAGAEAEGIDKVRAGDSVVVEAGDYLPLDGVLASESATLDTGLLTGESRPVAVRAGDPLFAGSLNLKSPIEVLVTGTGGHTRLDRLARELEELTAGRRALPDDLARIAGWFTFVVIAAGIAAAFIHQDKGLAQAAAIAASVFIISCSCALALAGPICRGLGLKRAQALGYHFKSQATLEALSDARCVLFDKTGTLTFMRRTVSGWTWLPPFAADTERQAAVLPALRELSRHSLHPVAVSLRLALEDVAGSAPALAGLREIPHFGLAAKAPAGKGFREICLCRFGAWQERDGAFAGLGYRLPRLPEGVSADSCLLLDGEPAALIRFTDEIKPDVAAMVRALEDRGTAVVLLSGDSPSKVEGFAAAAGIREFHGGLSPEAKRDRALQYRKRYGPCLAVGDGFNDSLLFGASDFALAVQGGAVDLSAGTDILASGDRPSALPRLLAISAGTRRALKACWWISGLYNVGAVAAAMAGFVTPLTAAILMPLSSLSLCLAAWLAIPRR